MEQSILKPNIENLQKVGDLFDYFPALPYEDRSQLPEQTGVYVVTEGKEKIIYIGKTNNFRTRWISHHKLSEIQDSYNIANLLILFCITPIRQIDSLEIALIQKYSPPLNSIMFTKEINDEWVLSGNPSDIPREGRLQIYARFTGICQMCGSNAPSDRITISKFLVIHHGIENYALICRSCSSTMRGADSFEIFRENQARILKRDLDRLSQQISRYYSEQCPQLKGISSFLNKNNVKLWYEDS